MSIAPLSGQCTLINSSINSEYWEDSPSLSPDSGKMLFVRSTTDQFPEELKRNIYWTDDWQKTLTVEQWEKEFAYNVSFGKDENTLLITQRLVTDSTEEVSFLIASKQGDDWKMNDQTRSNGIKASYAHQVADGSLYFFQYDGFKGPGLYRTI